MATRSIRVDRILCAVTFSPSSRRVIEWAASIASAVDDAELRLFHVLPGADAFASPELDEADCERTLNKLSALSRHLPGRTRMCAAVTDGDAAEEILRHARLVEADLIAMGMHGHDGNVSPLVRAIAIDAPCPVLAVNAYDERPVAGGDRPMTELVCAVNFLPASLAAVDYALALGRKTRASVAMVHVLPERWDGPPRTDAIVGETRRLLEHHFRQLLQTAIRDVSASHRDTREIVASGRPSVEIARLARVRAADLVVMGIDTEHESAHEAGDTAARVMEFAHCPVLLVPQQLFRAPRLRRGGRSTDTQMGMGIGH